MEGPWLVFFRLLGEFQGEVVCEGKSHPCKDRWGRSLDLYSRVAVGEFEFDPSIAGGGKHMEEEVVVGAEWPTAGVMGEKDGNPDCFTVVGLVLLRGLLVARVGWFS